LSSPELADSFLISEWFVPFDRSSMQVYGTIGIINPTRAFLDTGTFRFVDVVAVSLDVAKLGVAVLATHDQHGRSH